MARKKDSPQKAALRELMGNYLKENNVKVKDGTDVNSIMRDMMSIILEGALDQELDEELGYSKYDYRNKETDNSRNGHSQKTLHTSYGDMEIDIPRDRKGDFEPQVVKKYQNSITQDMEEKIISMYAKGMTTADIESHMRELYDLEISDSTVSRITDKILPIVKEWQERPLYLQMMIWHFPDTACMKNVDIKLAKTFMKLQTPQELYPSNLKWSPDRRPFLCLRFKSDSICTEHLSDIRHRILRH